MDFLKVSSSPHMRHEDTVSVIMADVIVALCPALIWATYIFGARALTLTLVSMVSSVIFEYLYRLITKKSVTVGDFSAAVSGMLLAYSLPISVPLWIPVVGSFFAIVIVKQLYGGIGKNVVNPALAARVFLFLAFPSEMATFPASAEKLPAFSLKGVDIVSTATPLASLKEGVAPTESVFELFIGDYAACIGEASVLLLLAGALYLFVRKIITWHIPVTYIATVAILAYLFPASGMDTVQFVLSSLCSGGLILGAFFMATDYTTSPVTPKGRIVYGIGCGLITYFIRACGSYPEGVSFAILVMNCLAWYLDKFTRPRVFGGGKKA